MIEQPASPVLASAPDPVGLAPELRAILDAVPDGITVQDRSGRLAYANDTAARLAGFPTATAMLAADPAELLERFELLDEAGRPFPLDALPGRLALRGMTPTPVTLQFRIVATGERRWSVLRATPLRDASGEVTHSVNAFQDITERVLVERELRSSESRYRLAAEAAAELDDSLDLEETIRVTATLAVPRIADWCVIDLLEPDGSVRRAAVRVGDPAFDEVAHGLWDYPSVPGSDGLMGRAMADGVTRLYAADRLDLALITSDARHAGILRALRPHSAIVVPLVARGATLGAIALVRGWSGRQFTETDLAMAEELGRRAALAIGNAALFTAEGAARRAAEAAAARTHRLQRLTRALAGTETRSDVAAVVIRHARDAFGAQGAAFYTVSNAGDELVAVAMEGYPRTHAERWQRMSLSAPSLLERVVRTGEDAWVSDLRPAAVERSEVREAIEVSRNHAAAGLPMSSRQVPLGALALTWSEPRSFGREERELGRAIADLAGQALERARLAEAREALVADLERQRARLTAVIEQMPGGVVIAEAPSGRIVRFNDQVERVLGAPPVMPQSLEDYAQSVGYDTQDGHRLAPGEWPLAQALEHGIRTENREIEVQREDGTRRTILASAAPIRVPDGTTIAAVLTFADITERRVADERERYLAEAGRILGSSLDYQETLRRVTALAVPRIADWCAIDLVEADGSADGLFVAHVDPAKVELARRLRELHPPRPDAETGVGAVIRTGRSELMTDLPAAALEAAAVDEEHLTILRALDLRSYMCVPLVAGGRVLGALTLIGAESGRRFADDDVGFAEALAARAAAAIENARLYRARVDAQERLERLAALEHARAAELDAVIAAMAEAIFVCDPAGVVTLANPAARALLGSIEHATYGDVTALLRDVDGRIPPLGLRAGPIERQAADTEDAWFELSTYPVGRETDGDAATPETIVVLRDITETRRRQTVRETFVGVLSHELRTPVTTIYGGSKLLARDTLDEERRRAVFEDIATEAERLHRLVEDVIALNRFGEAEGEVGHEPVLLQRVLPSVVRAEEPRWPGVRFELSIPPGLPTVEADRTYVEQVIRNLLSNAAKYGGAGTVVEVRAEADATEVRIRILDDGPGFPPEEAARLFELFFRSARTSGAAPGAGIGLFVCARLVRAMGGRIWAHPRSGRGSEFGFSLRVMSDE